MTLLATCIALPHSPIEDLLKSWNLNSDIVSFEHLPRPDEVVNYLSEDNFEDYLDFWLQKKYATEYQDSFEGRGFYRNY